MFVSVWYFLGVGNVFGGNLVVEEEEEIVVVLFLCIDLLWVVFKIGFKFF